MFVFARSVVLFCALLLVAVDFCSGADEQVENPLYRNWKAFPVGAMVTYRMETRAGGTHEVRYLSYKLVEKTDSQLVVELRNYVEGEKPEDVDANRQTSRRLVRLPEGVKKEEFGKRRGVLREGKETVELAGRQWDSEWYVVKVKVEVGETESRTWSCPDVPGSLVKSVNTTAATGSVTTIELVEVVTPGKS